MNRRRVDPAFTFAMSLAVALVLWYPTFRATLNGGIDITDSGIRYLLALAVAWAGVYGVSALVAMCAGKPRCPTSPPRPPDTGVAAQRQDDGQPPGSANDRSESTAA